MEGAVSGVAINLESLHILKSFSFMSVDIKEQCWNGL